MLRFNSLAYPLRLLKKKAGFNFLCILVIALGLCISVVDYYFISMLAYTDMPFANGDRVSLLRVGGSRNNYPAEYVWDAHRYNYVKNNAQSFEKLGAMQVNAPGVLGDGEVTELVRTAAIEPGLFNIPEIQPLLGRSLTDSDDILGSPRVAIISHRLWQSYYGAQPEIVGRVASVNSEPTTIIGVMPPGFGFPYNHDMWLPLQLDLNPSPRASGALVVAGLLSQDATFSSASRELENILENLTNEFPDIYSPYASDVQPYAVYQNAGAEPIVYAMIAAMIVIILLSCLNVGNLLLVRANERFHELWIRSAVGATRWQLLRQVLAESLLICIIGGIAGTILIYTSLELVDYFLFNSESSLSDQPFWVQPGLDAGLLGVAFSIVLLIWLLAGGIPAWKMTKIDTGFALGGSGKEAGSAGGNRATNILVIVELVTSVFLLIVSGVLVLSIQKGNSSDLGVDVEGLHTARVSLTGSEYEEPSSKLNYIDTLLSEIEIATGLSKITYTTSLPGSAGTLQTFILEDQNTPANSVLPSQFVISVADDYFQTMGVELKAGRFFDSSDNLDSTSVVIIDERFANSVATDFGLTDISSVVGKRIQIDPEQSSEWITIIGVTSHIAQGLTAGIDEGITTLYRPFAQRTGRRIILVFETLDSPSEILQEIRIAATKVDRSIPVYREATFDELAASNMVGFNTISTLFIVLSTVTLVLAASGIYAIISRSVIHRTQEAGIRRALGSSNSSAVMLFVRKGFVYFVIAIVFGGILAALTSQGLDSIFPNILRFFPVIFASVVSIFSFVIIGSSYLPARKIIAMEPGEALHYE